MRKNQAVKEDQSSSGDMTRGNPWKKLIIFAIPILLGSILQQLYNAVDAVIVGHAVGSVALGAVGSTGSIIQLLIALFMGLSSGTCVVVANYYGKKDKDNLSKAVHTGIIITVVASLIMAIIGVIISPLLLRWINTPQEMMADAVIYLQIFFAGITGLAIYNIGASILQAVGNSRYPLYFLLATTILNILLDILFVIMLDMGVAGAAVATIISQFVSAALVIIVLMNSKREYKVSFKNLKIDKAIAKRIMAIGLPGALQQSIVSVSNIMVQSYINGLGTGAVAGYTVSNKIDAFLPLPISSLALTTTTFVSQNLGAGKEERARKGVWQALWMGMAVTTFLSLLVFIFNDTVFKIFSTDVEVFKNGWLFAQVIIPGYAVLAFPQILSGALRGASKVKFATLASITSYVLVRQIYLMIATKFSYTIFVVALAYPGTWTICATALLIYYLRKNRITSEGLTRIHIVHTDGLNQDFLELCDKLDTFQNENVPGRREAGLSAKYNPESLRDIFLLYDDTTVVGSAGLWRHDDETCEVVRFYIDKTHRDSDYAKMLVTHVKSLAKSLGYKHMHLRTFNSIKSDVDICEQIGFSTINSDDFKYVDKYSQALLLAPLRVYMKQDLL